MTRGQSISDFDRRHSSPAPQMSPTGRRPIPQTMHEFQAPRNHPQSVSVANLSMQRVIICVQQLVHICMYYLAQNDIIIYLIDIFLF